MTDYLEALLMGEERPDPTEFPENAAPASRPEPGETALQRAERPEVSPARRGEGMPPDGPEPVDGAAREEVPDLPGGERTPAYPRDLPRTARTQGYPDMTGAGAEAPAPLPDWERTAAPASDDIRWAERVDRAFRRDSRRYDGGFYLY